MRTLLLLVTAAALCSCTTLSNRRDLYSPLKGQGPYTAQLDQMDSAHILAVTPRTLRTKSNIVAGRPGR